MCMVMWVSMIVIMTIIVPYLVNMAMFIYLLFFYFFRKFLIYIGYVLIGILVVLIMVMGIVIFNYRLVMRIVVNHLGDFRLRVDMCIMRVS